MGYAEVISLSEVRASKQWASLRHQLHDRFDQWLDRLEAQLPEPETTLAQITETVWNLRQELTGSLTESLVEHAHQVELTRKEIVCATCDRLLAARPAVSRTVDTMVGAVQLERPYFYCRHCHQGQSPLDEALGLTPGRKQLDVQQAAAQVVVEMPYDEAHTLFGDLTGVTIGSERMHTLTNQVAQGLTVLDVAPSRQEIERRIASVAAGRFRRPVLVLGIDGAYVPTRPENARGRRPGQGRYRAKRPRWTGQWREAKGLRFYLMDGERIVHVLSWHQVQTEAELGEALQQIKDAGLIPEEQVRLCVVCDGASWIWKHIQTLFPHARQVLDYYHCAAYLHKVAKAQYGDSVQALEWVEATLTRLYLGKAGAVLGGLKRLHAPSEEAAKAVANCWAYLHAHRGRTHYQKLRRGGYPLGSGGIESSNKFICHTRLKRSGAWWYEGNSNQMLALRCAKYNGTFNQVFARHQQRLREA
ncbi:MAG: ISKra4 family transposase [Candidatus Tectomicrobia bacterium]|nr:ISKra4 family transposase [Candidatus Tectomicrobia bacterium]